MNDHTLCGVMESIQVYEAWDLGSIPSRVICHIGHVAQVVAHMVCNHEVPGSNPGVSMGNISFPNYFDQGLLV